MKVKSLGIVKDKVDKYLEAEGIESWSGRADEPWDRSAMIKVNGRLGLKD